VCESGVSRLLPHAMDYAGSGATLTWVSMSRRVSRPSAPAQVSSRPGPRRFEGKRRRTEAFPQKENKGIGVSGLKNARDFTKAKRKTQRGQRNVRVYFSSGDVPVGTRSWRRKMSLKTEEQNLHIAWRSEDPGLPKAS